MTVKYLKRTHFGPLRYNSLNSGLSPTDTYCDAIVDKSCPYTNLTGPRWNRLSTGVFKALVSPRPGPATRCGASQRSCKRSKEDYI